MKTNKLIKQTILVMAVVTFCGCQPPQFKSATSVEVVVNYDITPSNESTNLDLKAADIISLFGVNENPFNYGVYRSSILSSVHLNHITQLRLPQIESIGDYQEYVREAEIKKFSDGIAKSIAELKQATKGRDYSSLLRPMSSELNRLSKSEASRKYYLCYTDLMQNDPLLSVYSKSTLNMLQNNPEEFTKRFLEAVPLNDLGNIRVFIIYNTTNEVNAEYFRLVSEWWSGLLESKGAEVTISANLVL